MDVHVLWILVLKHPCFMDIHLNILGFLWISMHWLAMDSRSRATLNPRGCTKCLWMTLNSPDCTRYPWMNLNRWDCARYLCLYLRRFDVLYFPKRTSYSSQSEVKRPFISPICSPDWSQRPSLHPTNVLITRRMFNGDQRGQETWGKKRVIELVPDNRSSFVTGC